MCDGEKGIFQQWATTLEALLADGPGLERALGCVGKPAAGVARRTFGECPHTQKFNQDLDTSSRQLNTVLLNHTAG